MKKCSGLKTISIHTLIDQVLREAEEMMKGSVHEKDFFIYHNTLLLMTGKGPVEFMQEKGF